MLRIIAIKTSLAGTALTLLLVLLSFAAVVQNSARVRGTITAFDGEVLAVKSIEGQDLKLQLANNTNIVYPKAIGLADLKPGEYVGVTSARNNEGRLVAREVHTISSTAAEGHRPLAQDPTSNMTNANIAKAVKSANGHELTLEYKGGSQTILVPDGTPIVTTVVTDRSVLVRGVAVNITATVAADGAMTAERIQANKDGIKLVQ